MFRFHPRDLVYGPSARGALRRFQVARGGLLLTDLEKPLDSTWEQFTILEMERSLTTSSRQIHFDLTHVQDVAEIVEDVLCDHPPPCVHRSITALELRYLRTHWARFARVVRFYRNDEEVEAPW